MSLQGKDPQNIVVHVGSNDLNHYSQELLSKEFEDLIEYIQEKHRFSKILISLVLQKMGNYQFNRKTKEVNQFLKDLCLNKKVSYVFHNNIKLMTYSEQIRYTYQIEELQCLLTTLKNNQEVISAMKGNTAEMV